MKTQVVKLTQLHTNKANPRTITPEKFDKLVNSILVFPKMLELRPIVVDATMVALGGNMRYLALVAISEMSYEEMAKRLAQAPEYNALTATEKSKLVDYWEAWKDQPTATIIDATTLSDAEQRAFIIKDNASFGAWDMDALANEWDAEDLDRWGVDVWQEEEKDTTTPTEDDSEGETLTFEVSPQQAEYIMQQIASVQSYEIHTNGRECTESEALYLLAKQWQKVPK